MQAAKMEIIKDILSTSVGIRDSRVWSLKQTRWKMQTCCNFPFQPCDKHQLFLLSRGAVSKRILLPLKAAYGCGAGIFLRMKHYLNTTSMSRILEASNYFPKASCDVKTIQTILRPPFIMVPISRGVQPWDGTIVVLSMTQHAFHLMRSN